jgi:ABC-type multidrug transport system fused ATPase/permease subunit
MAIRGLNGPLNHLTAHIMQVQRHAASVQRIAELLDREPELRDRPDAVAFPATFERIRFENVGYQYPTGRAALHDVSFEVRSGEVVGVVGPSGSGKTTLLNLVTRFIDPVMGRIVVDGRDLRAYRLADLYAHVAVVTQEPFLFAATVRENIRCGRPGASDADVEEAARAAEIHDDILTLGAGYDTEVGLGGHGLSGGQVQRINVARAILKNAPLLVLDEATSSLDSVAEAKVQRAITRLMHGRTTFIAAHRLSTLRSATTIVVLERGRVAATGPHESLVLTSSLYRQLWKAQEIGAAKARA